MMTYVIQTGLKSSNLLPGWKEEAGSFVAAAKA